MIPVLILAPMLLILQGILTAGTTATNEVDSLSRSFEHPVKVINKSGHTIYGLIESASDTQIVLKNDVDAGEVTYTLFKDDIAEISLPGRDIEVRAYELINDDRQGEAVPLLTLLYHNRSAFLGLLSNKDVLIFTHLVNAYLQSNEYTKCLAIAQRLDPLVKDPQVKKFIKDALILCHFHLGNYAETELLALSWVDHAQPFYSSALGWWLLAMIEFSKDQYESALWTSMKPIVFSGQIPMEFLSESYAVAIAACIELNYEKEAATLLEEMHNRGLNWPDHELLEPYAPR